MSEIVLKNVCKQYEKGQQYAVQDVSLRIEEGEFVIFVGPSGCGKSTTLRMIAGLEEISRGELWMDGALCNYVEPKERGLAMVFQNYALYPHMNVYDNLAFSLQIRKVDKKEIDRRVHEAAGMLGIEHLLWQRPGSLSGGQKQRVAIGSALVRNAKVFLLDEPLSNLDAKLRAQMRVELAEIHRKLGATMIYVTHDQTEAMTLGTKIVVMDQGRIRQADRPAEIYNHPADRFVAGFIGSPSMNFFKGTIRVPGRAAFLELADGTMLEVPENRVGLLAEKYAGQRVVLGIRPEDLHEAGWPGGSGKTGHEDRSSWKLEGEIGAREMLGSECMLYLESDAGDFAARLPVAVRGAVGEKKQLYLDMTRAHYFDAQTEKNIFYREGRDLV